MSEDTRASVQSGAESKFWTRDRLEIWMRVGIPALASVVVGLATIFIDHRISVRAEREQSSRLYTELLSRREEAASELRKDMFATILAGFLERGGAEGGPRGSKRIDRDLMQLELLALNFGEALSLGPLFSMMDRRIRTDTSYESDMERVDRGKFQDRLGSLARRVSDGQRASLGRQAAEFTITIPSAMIGESGSYTWPYQSDDADDLVHACLTLGRTQRNFVITFDNPVPDARTIRVDLQIVSYTLSEDAPQSCVEELEDACPDLPARCAAYAKGSDTKSKFTLNPFNLPLIDNSLLSDDQRFALIMRKFSPDAETEVVGVLFPGAYAGRRDKMTLDQAIDALRGRIR